MKACKFLTALMACSMFAASAQGATMAHQFAANGTVAPFDDRGDLARQQWQYLDYAPWDGALGTLQSLTAAIDGSKNDGDLPQAHYVAVSHPAPSHAPVAHVAYKTEAAKRISEPGSELLMLVALAALAIMVRRKMPE